MQLQRKYFAFKARGTPLLIKSAVALDHLKNFIYVEAEKESHVMEAINGIRNLFRGKGVTKVPVTEMVAAVTVSSSAGG